MNNAQHMVALRRANEVRYGRAAIKRDLKAGRKSLKSLIEDPPSEIDTATVFELIMAQHRYGRSRALTILRKIPISESKQVWDLTERQRGALLAAL